MNERKNRGDRSPQRRPAEGVRIIRADEAQAALDAGEAAGRRPDDELALRRRPAGAVRAPPAASVPAAGLGRSRRGRSASAAGGAPARARSSTTDAGAPRPVAAPDEPCWGGQPAAAGRGPQRPATDDGSRIPGVTEARPSVGLPAEPRAAAGAGRWTPGPLHRRASRRPWLPPRKGSP